MRGEKQREMMSDAGTLPFVTVTLYISASLDGYIAGPDDDLSWLFTDADYGFSNFYADVDTLIMGRGTYDVLRKFGPWPYTGKRAIIVSRGSDLELTTKDTELYCAELPELIEKLEAEGCKNVWLVGGSELVRSFLTQDVLDMITVSVHPILLGKGVKLFQGGFQQTSLLLANTEVFESGLVQLTYHVLPSDED